MSVSNGQLANETTFNTAFPSRTVNTSMAGIVALQNADAASGTALTNIQREMNSLASYSGKAVNTAKDDVPVFTNNDVGTAGDDLTERADALTEQFNETTGHTHDGSPGEGGPIEAASLTAVRLRGYFVKGVNLTGITGNSLDVSTQMTGKTTSTGDTVKGVVVSVNNLVILKDNTAATQGDQLKDANGDLIYGRITEAAGVWTLSFFKNVAGVETAHAFTAQDIAWYYQELFNPITDAPVYNELAAIPSDNATQDVIDATASLRGLVSAGAQSFGGVKTFADTTQSTTKDNGAVVIEGGLGVEKNANVGGNVAATGTVTGSNLSGTNTGDVTLAAIGGVPNANGASLAGQVLTLQPADATFGGVLTAIAQSIVGAKTFITALIAAAYLALTRGDTASAASIAQLSSATSFRKLTGSTATTIHGIAAGIDGQLITIHNGSSQTATVKHQSVTATAADRLKLPNATDITIDPDSSASFIYDTAQSRWVVASGSGSGSGSGGGGMALEWVESLDAPVAAVDLNCQVYQFADAISQALYALVKVPANYTAGKQIKMNISPYSKDATTKTMLINAVATLVRPGTDALDSTTNQRTTTNTAINIGAATVKIPQAAVLDLTDATGNINGVAVAAGNLILVKLQRDFANDTSAEDVYVPVYGAEVTFNG